MQALEIRNDGLVEIGTFLARRWSANDGATIEFSDKSETLTKIKDSRIILLPIEKLKGDGFEKYRQFRTALWYETMRLRFCKKILSNDHAFGFILNTLETRRIEALGRRIWRGMDEELIFYYSYQWSYRPALNTVYGKARMVEGFYQHFLFDGIKGELSASQFERVKKASAFARAASKEAIQDGHDTAWLEKKIPEIIKILDIDSLLTVPIALPWMKPGMALNQEELMKTLIKISKNREGDFGKVDPQAAMRGDDVRGEYKVLVDENKKNENRGLSVESVGIQTPHRTNVDETVIYDLDLINGLKTRFKEWRSGWSEEHSESGDELDEEAYMEGHAAFFTDIKKTIKTEIAIMLDHSSSISGDQLEYKKATLALCEVLSYLKVKFSVYAFSTVNKSVVCWLIKSGAQKWNSICAKRLTQIDANGSTPLAEVYDRMHPVLESKRPKIFLTLTDGEPADPNAVRSMIKSYRNLGIQMAALGLGPDTIRATTIASNLRRLGYERTLAVSRLNDIPNKVLGILSES